MKYIQEYASFAVQYYKNKRKIIFKQGGGGLAPDSPVLYPPLKCSLLVKVTYEIHEH